MSTTRMRQFVVTDRATGIVTLVNAEEYLTVRGVYNGGLRCGVGADVSVVPFGDEIPLPFDCLPLQIRRRTPS